MIGEFKYKAFITYAHRDEERARWLRKKLEGFRVPKHLIGKNSPFGPVPSRLYPIFRDRDELAELPNSALLSNRLLLTLLI